MTVIAECMVVFLKALGGLVIFFCGALAVGIVCAVVSKSWVLYRIKKHFPG
jgi:hypothetical protein